MSKLSYFKQLSTAQVRILVLFNPLIGLYQVLPFHARVDLGVIEIKVYSTFP